MFMTITARLDSAFPGLLFMLLRRYDLDGDDAPVETTEVTSVEDATATVQRWLRSFAS